MVSRMVRYISEYTTCILQKYIHFLKEIIEAIENGNERKTIEKIINAINTVTFDQIEEPLYREGREVKEIRVSFMEQGKMKQRIKERIASVNELAK